MGFTITSAFVQGYKNNIHMLSQQKTARLFGTVRQEQQASKLDYYERVGVTEANDVTQRNRDTPINNAPLSRRAVVLKDSDWGELIDSLDRVRLLINPDDSFVKIAVAALNRKQDDLFIAACLGIAKAGEDGEISVAFPESQRTVATNAGGTALATLSVRTLKRVSRKYDDADVDEDDTRYFVFNGAQKEALLGELEIASADFNSVKALVEGRINSFMGFTFIRSERLPVLGTAITTASFAAGTTTGGADVVPAGSDRLIAYTTSGMLASSGMDITVKIGPRADKAWSTQIFVEQSKGAVRMEEELCQEILCLAN